MKDLFYFISGIGVTVACELWRLGVVVRLHHTRKQKLYYLVIAQQVERVFWEHEVVSSNLSSQTCQVPVRRDKSVLKRV